MLGRNFGDTFPATADDTDRADAGAAALDALKQFAHRLEQIHALSAETLPERRRLRQQQQQQQQVQKQQQAQPPPPPPASVQKATLFDLGTLLFALYPQLPSIRLLSSSNYYSREAGLSTTSEDDYECCPRQSILRFLAVECAPSMATVQTAVESYYKHYHSPNEERPSVDASSSSSSSSSSQQQQAVAKLRYACAPAYERVIRALFQQNSVQAMQFLVELREDLLAWLPYLQQDVHHHHHAATTMQHQQQQTPVDEEQTVQETVASKHGAFTADGQEGQHELISCLKQLDGHLRTLFTTWFSPGMLQVRRITYDDTPAAIIETIAKQEAVHPMRSLDDLRNRLSGQDRRVFGLFHPLLPQQPLVVLYVSLQPTTPKSMTQVHEYYSTSSSTLADDQEYTTTTIPRVATFYSISNLQPGLAGVGLGEYLIKQAVDRIRSEVSTVDTFVTLSPLPRFTKWLQEKLAHQQAAATVVSNVSESSSSRSSPDQGKFADPLLSPSNPRHGRLLELLAKRLDCHRDQAIAELVDQLRRLQIRHGGIVVENLNETMQDSKFILDDPVVEEVMKSLAARYLVQEKHRGKPLDTVARFHVGNGATVDRIHWGADLSQKGWRNSFGIMVNYRYSPFDDLARNQAQYEMSSTIAISPEVERLLEQ